MPASLKSLHCLQAELRIIFNQRIFHTSKFLKDVKEKQKHGEYSYIFGSKSKRVAEHAHLVLDLDGDMSSLRLTYHLGPSEVPDVREPFMEDMPKWIAQFFDRPILKCSFSAGYFFDKKYDLAVRVNFPLLVEHDLLKGVYVAGHQLEFPDESEIERMFISKLDDSISLAVHSRMEASLATFDVHKAVKSIGRYVTAIVEKK